MKDICEMIESENIVKLKKISPKLQDAFKFATLFETVHHDRDWKEIGTSEGSIFFKTIHWEEAVAISLNIASAGAEYPPHQHEGIEIFCVYSGELIFTHNGKTVRIKAREKPYYFNGIEKHSGICEKNTKFVAITMPGDEGWKPDERRHKRDF